MTLRSVALYGFAPNSREGIWQSKADEIWSIVWAYKYDVPRIDRLLEIHPIWMQAKSQKPEFEKPRQHWEWMKQNTSIPIYMTVQHPEVPMCVQYPIEEAMNLVPPARRRKVFTSSFDYLMAMAIVEGAERIEVYGFDMGSDTEYRYQREGAAYWIAQCDVRGIELVLPDNTALLKNKLYGYEGGSMIYRQDMETVKAQQTQRKIEASARLNYTEGLLAKDPDNEKLKDDWNNQYRMLLVLDGALQMVEKLLQEIDLEEPAYDEFLDTTLVIPV